MNGPLKKTAWFIAVSYAFGLSLILGFHLSGGRWNTGAAFAVATLYMYTPLAAALLVQKLLFKKQARDFLFASFKLNRWFALAWALPFVLAVFTFLFSLAIPGAAFSPDLSGLFERMQKTLPPDQVEHLRSQMAHLPVSPVLISLFQAVIAGVSVNALFAFGEEAGWRGFLQHEFREWSFIKSSLVIGAIWGVWHAPIILMGHNYPEHPVPGVFMMVLLCLLLSPFFSYVRLKSGSTIAAAIVHGSFNAVAGLPILLLKGGNDLTVGITGLSGMAALVLIDAGIVIYDRFFAREKIIFGREL
jgi:membrane protease YdiL (CAAX protease family)